MKKLLIFLCFIPAFSLLSQSFNRAIHIHDDEAYHIAAINNSFFFSSDRHANWFVDTAVIYSMNKSGQINFRKTIVKNEYNHIEKIVATSDKGLVFTGYGRGCDFFDNSQKTYLMKIDTIGNTVFDNTFSNLYSNAQNDYLKNIVEAADGTFYCISDSVLFHFNKNGLLIKRKNTGLNSLKSLLYIGTNRLLVSGKNNGVQKHFLIDTNAVMLQSSSSGHAVSRYGKLSSGNIIALSQSSLKKLNANLFPVDSSLSAGIIDFSIAQDTIYALGLTGNTYTYLKLDSTFFLQHQFVSSSPGIIPKGIAVANEDVGIISNSTNTVIGASRSMALSGFNKTGSINYQTDVGLIFISADSLNITASPDINPNYTKYVGNYRLKIIVKNFGSMPVQSFYLNHYLNSEICGTSYYHPLITAPLAPGATLTISSPVFQKLLHVEQGPPRDTTFTMNNVCVYTSVPNARNDGNQNNDASCTSFTFPFVTGIKKNYGIDNSINLYPNPFKDVLNVKSETQIDHIEIYNTTGKLICQSDATGKMISRDLKDLPAGMYFIKLRMGQQTIIKKAAKE